MEYPVLCLETFCICGHHVSHLEAKPRVIFDALRTGSKGILIMSLPGW